MDFCLIDENVLKLNNDICVWNFSADRTPAPYSHAFLMMAFIAKGKGCHRVAGKDIPVSEGDAFLVNSNVSHCFYSDADSEMTVYYCCFYPKSIGAHYDGIRNAFPTLRGFFCKNRPCLHVRDNSRRELQSLFLSMLEDFNQTLPGSEQTLICSAVLLFCKICRMYLAAKETVSYSSNKTVDKSIRLILQNYNQKLTVDYIAERQNISVSQLNRLFRKHTGMSVIGYINNLRVEKIKYLLLNTTRPIDLIAAEYDLTPKYINRLFRQYTGCSMYRFRKALIQPSGPVSSASSSR